MMTLDHRVIFGLTPTAIRRAANPATIAENALDRDSGERMTLLVWPSTVMEVIDAEHNQYAYWI